VARILVLLNDPPLPFGNAAARWYYVLCRGLVERGHEVTTFAICDDDALAERARQLFPSTRYDLKLYRPPSRRGPWKKLESIHRPFSYLFSPSLHADLNAALGHGCDVLHLEQTWSGWLGLAHVSRALVNVHYLFDIDHEGMTQTPFVERLRGLNARRAERMLLRRYPTISTLTPRLSERASQLAPASTVHTVPFGMDLTLYPFDERPELSNRPTVGLIGSFNWRPSFTAGERLLTRLWPQIKRQVPSARLQIVGRRAKSALAHLPLSCDVEILEDVPDTLPYFQGMDALLYAPGRGSGMKVKVLEAFALGTPVVTTSEGVEGLPAEDRVHAGVCEEDAGLIERTVALLQDQKRAADQRIAARRLVETICSPEHVLDQLEQVYAGIINRNARRMTERVGASIS
jgi:glycosyltransferase involved in cell wall biosynthesis